jgi:ABC-type Na+ transport system ATPase subunit NatA
MKLALILNVIDPKIGGVMIMGDRGTGKTTTIRALADLLPEVPVVAKDPFNSGKAAALAAAPVLLLPALAPLHAFLLVTGHVLCLIRWCDGTSGVNSCARSASICDKSVWTVELALQ